MPLVDDECRHLAQGLGDFFHIIVVKDFITLLILADVLCDQFGFKPTGSTTAALIDRTHIVSAMLEDNRYVRCLLVDLSKAFDAVDHCKFINKLKSYNIADNVIQWVVSFLSERDQFTKFGGKSSIICIINNCARVRNSVNDSHYIHS